jgi:hypothetical protein
MADDPQTDKDGRWTPQGWVTLIGAIVLALGQISQMAIGYMRENAAIIERREAARKVEEVADKQDKAVKAVEQVKETLETTTDDHSKKLGDLSDKVDEVLAKGGQN